MSSVFPSDIWTEPIIRTAMAPAYRVELEKLIKARLINPTIPRRGLDFECGRGSVTIAALQVFPNLYIVGVDIDARLGYDILTEQEKRRTIFVHAAVQQFVNSPCDPFNIVLAGSIRVPNEFDYKAFGNIVNPGGLVLELSSQPDLPDFSIHGMAEAGFEMSYRFDRGWWSNTVWIKP